jgi:hypothetical protein
LAERGADTISRRATYEYRYAALAEIALAEGRYRDAMELFRKSAFGPDGMPLSACTVCILPHLARVAQRAGWIDSARIYWEEYVTRPAINRLDTDQWYLAMAYRKLVALADSSGDVTAAVDYRKKLADLWKLADPGIVTTDHERLARAARREGPVLP